MAEPEGSILSAILREFSISNSSKVQEPPLRGHSGANRIMESSEAVITLPASVHLQVVPWMLGKLLPGHGV